MKIDLESLELKEEIEKTRKFANNVCESKGLYSNPIASENERIYIGLSRNKIIHGKRYCPCFMVFGKTAKEKAQMDNRVCPCTPAIEEEIPNEGKCHCGIFCTKEYINNFNSEKQKEDMAPSQEQLLKSLQQKEINGADLVALLEARKKKNIDFVLIDVREQSEYETKHIVGVDYLLPTSIFYEKVQKLKKHKKDHIIVQCHSGGRSFQVQQILKKMQYKNVINLTGGISKYLGETS